MSIEKPAWSAAPSLPYRAGAPDDLARSREAGFDMHFTKPIAPARLDDFLKSLP